MPQEGKELKRQCTAHILERCISVQNKEVSSTDTKITRAYHSLEKCAMGNAILSHKYNHEHIKPAYTKKNLKKEFIPMFYSTLCNTKQAVSVCPCP